LEIIVEKVAKDSAFSVGDWQVDVAANRLRRGKKEVKVESRVMEVLVYLANRPGQIVTRQELERDVWAGRVVSYESLTSTINKLRKALGDSARNPRVIETVSKKGYRFIGEIGAQKALQQPGNSSTEITGSSIKSKSFKSSPIYWVPVFIVIALTISLFVVLNDTDVGDNKENIITVRPDHETQSLTVLPFVDISSDTSKRYLGDGITEDLTTALSRISGFFVISRSSAMIYKDQAIDVKQVAEQLGVSYVVEGSVQREGDNIRINAYLIDGKTGFQLWAQQYDRQVTDIFKVQDSITRKIVEALSVKLTEEETKRTAQRYTVSFDAYDTFLQGQVYYVRHTNEDNHKARDLFQHAIELDPQFARAYSATALTYSAEYRYGWASDRQVALNEAQLLAEKAVGIDNQLPQSYWVLGYIYLQQRKYDKAITAAKQAIKLNPNFADGFATLGVSYIYAGDPHNGMQMMQQAVRLSPQYPAPYASALGQAYYFLERYDDAISMLKQAIDRNVNLLTSHVFYIASLSRLGKLDEANWAAVQFKSLAPDFKLDDVGEMFPINNQQHLENIKADLRRAGIQEEESIN
jgi:TolB-like protein/DNA-binding winged helix-turn-helix (wHTH) protein